MKNVKSKVAIAFVCLVLGLILAIQFKTVNKTVGPGYLPLQRSKDLSVELNKLQEEKKNLLKELENLEGKVKAYEKNASEESAYIKELSEELLRYRMFAGYEKVQGPGIILTIDDPPIKPEYGDQTSMIVENYDLLLQVISYLNVAEAEAIAINGQRYSNTTEILRINNHLNINGAAVGPPIEIKAIGNPEKLETALRLKGGLIYSLENYYQMSIKITQEKNLEIPRYTKIRDFRYAEPILDLE